MKPSRSSMWQNECANNPQGHGELDTIYASLETQCKARDWPLASIDFLLICGDFQAVRNERDLACMSVPRRYRRLEDFHRYYSGEATAPVLTIVIGGNHEASNYSFELYHGGWLAPNIYYLGAAGVVRYGPWRIGGISGIYLPGDYEKPHYERLPYDRDMIKSVYHVRGYDVAKMKRLTRGGSASSGRGVIDVCMSHDWPQWVELFGDYESLYRDKPHFLESAKKDYLGSRPAKELLGQLRPSYWFSGHMHWKFSADIEHKEAVIDETIRGLPVPNDLKTKLPVFNRSKRTSAQPSDVCSPPATTHFHALSKVGPHIPYYLELLELELPPQGDAEESFPKEESGSYTLCYDEEWLAITRAYNDSLRVADPETLVVPPEPRTHGKHKAEPPTIEDHKAWVKENIADKGLLRIPRNFIAHAPTQSSMTSQSGRRSEDQQPEEYLNEQTVKFCELLQMTNKFTESVGEVVDDGGVEFGWD